MIFDMLKALVLMIQPELGQLLISFVMTLGFQAGDFLMKRCAGNQDIVLVVQWVAINSGLLWWCSQVNPKQSFAIIPRSYRALGLMMIDKVYFIIEAFMILFVSKESNLKWEVDVEKHLMKRRPPNPQAKIEIIRKRRRRLNMALTMEALVPSLGLQRQVNLQQDLIAFISTNGMLKTGSLPQILKQQIREDLSANSRDLLNIKGIHTSVADTGSSSGLIADKARFKLGSYVLLDKPVMVGGIAGGLQVIGKGDLKMEFLDNKGRVKKITRQVYHAPDVPVDLLPPQLIMRNSRDGWFRINGEEASLEFQDGSVVKVPTDSVTRLPMFVTFDSVDEAAQQLETSMYSCVTQESNQNLDPAKKSLLKWHWRLGHRSMQVVKWLAHRGLLGKDSKRITSIKQEDHPLCATCQYGKQTRKPSGRKIPDKIEKKVHSLSSQAMNPGDIVVSDQFVCSEGGRLFHTSGRDHEADRYKGGTIFIDLATNWIFVKSQVSLGAEETSQARACFEREARMRGIKVKRYHTDNGVFTSQGFTNKLNEDEKRLTLSGVGAHHQNPVAERNIRTVVSMARTQLLHAQLRWSDQTPVSLWPMSLDHATNLLNALPHPDSGMSANELWTRTTSRNEDLLHLQPWGCPTYILMPTLQDGKKLPKWKPRSRRGQFMGWSSSHAASVAVVRNLMTGNLSPQFHVVFDPWFETVSEQGDDITPATWDVLVTNYRHENEFDSEDLSDRHLHDDWLSKEELLEKRTQEAQKRASMMRPKRHDRQQTEVEEIPTNTEMVPQENDVAHSL